jgi:hypothetical protein
VRDWIAYSLVIVVATALQGEAQMSAPSVPDNTLNSTDTIGLPPASSREGNSEIVNLSNGALNLFIPAVTLPQRAGAAPLQLGFTYDSNQINLQQTVSASAVLWGDTLGACDGFCPAVQDSYNYYMRTAQTTLSGSPLDLNIPQLSASLEYYGDWENTFTNGSSAQVGTRFCLTNVAFKDWKGTTHAFPAALVACDDENVGDDPVVGLILQDNSGDNLFYHLDARNRLDYAVYASQVSSSSTCI